MAPPAVVVTEVAGSPASITLLPLLSNQILPVVLAAKPDPVMLTEVPAGPLTGERAMLTTT